MLASAKVRTAAEKRMKDYSDPESLYLVRLKYNGIREIELFALESISGRGVRDFGWVLLGFGERGMGGQGNILSLDKKSAWLDGSLITSGVIPSRGIAQGIHTDASLYVPFTRYENLRIKKATRGILVLQDAMNKDTYSIKRGRKEDDMRDLAHLIESKQTVVDSKSRAGLKLQKFATESQDLLLKKAITLVVKRQVASTALLQRELRISYARAARLISKMESFGVVSVANGADPRRILVKTVTEALGRLPESIGLQFEIGQTEDGSHFIANFSRTGHYISTGHVGSGHASFDEGAFVAGLVEDYTSGELQFAMIDPKQVQLIPYEGMPYLWRPLALNPDDAKKIVSDLLEEMEKRFNLLKDSGSDSLAEYNRAADVPLPYIILLCTELADLMMIDGRYYTEAFKSMAMKSKVVGIHMYLATQRPSDDVLSPEFASHIFGRLMFATVRTSDIERLLPGRVEEVESLERPGELIYADADVTGVKIQARYVSDAEIEKLVEALG